MAEALDKLVNEMDQYIDTTEDAFFSGFDAIENSIYSAIMRQVYKMDQEEGHILFNETNLLILAIIANEMVMAIQNSSYPTKVQNFVGSFEDVKNYNLEIQNMVNGTPLDELDVIVTDLQAEITRQVVDGLTGQGMASAFIKPVTEGIYKNIVSGATIEDLQASLLQVIKGDEARLGAFRRYVTQISRDAIMQYQGQLNARIAAEMGYDAYRYVGTIIRDSRPQCIQWLGMGILLKKDLPNLIASAEASGSGMIPGTTAENFAIYRGGYNCRHTAVPIKLTKSQKQEMGL